MLDEASFFEDRVNTDERKKIDSKDKQGLNCSVEFDIITMRINDMCRFVFGYRYYIILYASNLHKPLICQAVRAYFSTLVYLLQKSKVLSYFKEHNEMLDRINLTF